MKNHFLFVFLILFLTSCSASKKLTGISVETITSLKFIDVYELPHNLNYKGTTVGGLSGIDYDKVNDVYYLISDDRSAINAARFYTAKVYFNEKKIDSVAFVNVTTLLQHNGAAYPSSKEDPSHTPDPEALRYDAVRKQMIWTSEGERIVGAKDTVLENPAITLISVDGKFIDSFPLPINLRMQANEKGPRQNGVLEGMSFSKDFKTLFVNVEEPLYEDGPRADLTDNHPWIRIYQFDLGSKKNTRQYAYQLDPVAYPAIPADKFMVNGIPDILSVTDKKLIVLERSFSTGRLACTIKIFLADLEKASDIKENVSLLQTPHATLVSKKLLLNMDSLGIYVDNVEGVTFGPNLPNGHKTLLMVADNNFAAFEKTQFFLFEIIP